MNNLRKTYKLILIGVGLAAFFWIIESGIHAFFFHDSNLINQILRPDANEIWMRGLIGFILISFSVYAQIIVRQLRQAKVRLQQSNDKLEFRVRERTAELAKTNEKLQVEEALRISEEKLSKAFRSSPNIMGILDLQNRRRIEAGGDFLRITGYSREEVIGTTLEELDIFIDKAKVEEFLRTLDKEGSVREIEIRIRTKTGQERTILYSGEVFEMKGEKYAIIVGDDITERKHAESSLRESEEALRAERDKLRALMDGINRAGIGIDIVGTDYKVLFQNETLEEKYGKLCGKFCYEHYMALEEHCDQCSVVEAIKDNKAVSAEQRGLNGRDYQVLSAPIPDADGTVSKAIEIVLDITERKQAENALRFTQFSVDHAADAAFWMGPDAKFMYVNEAACRSLGYSREELLTMSVHDIDPDFPVEAWPAHWSEVKEQGAFTIESHHRAKNGRVFPVEVSVNYLAFEGNEYNCAFAKDISERKQTENALRQHDKFLGCVLESLTHPFLVIDANDYTIDMLNSAAWKGELTEGATCYEVSHKRDRPCGDAEHPCPLEHVKKTGQPVTVEHVHYDQERNARDVEVHSYPLFDDQGNVTKMIEYCLDVTERKQAEEALVENERQFRATFEQAAVGVAHVAPDGKFIRINQKFCDIVGYTHTEMLDRTFQDITHPNDLDADLGYVQQMLADEISTYSMEKRYFRKDGSIVWVNLTVSLLWEDLGEPKFFISVVEDITERRRAEEALEERLEFETLLTELSAEFVNLPSEQVDDRIEYWLQRIVQFLSIDRVTLSEFSEDKILARVVHSGAIEGVEPIPSQVVSADAPWALSKVLRGEIFMFSRLDDIPNEATLEKQFFGRLSVKSHLSVPLTVAGSVLGAISFVTVRTERNWPANIVRRLRFIGEIFANVLGRKRTDEKLRTYQERLRLLASELSLAEERQRRRIATELHDNTSQELAFALTKLQNIRETASRNSLESLNDVCEMMSNVVENVRNMTFDICSPTLYRFGLETAVSELLEDKLGVQDEVSYSFYDDKKTKTLSEDVKVVLFQSVRELVNNIIKHAQASNVTVDIRRCKDTIKIVANDDGVGFKVNELESPEQSRSGFGLFSITERLKYIGGSFEFQSQPGHGSSFTLEAPLEADAN